MCHGMNQNAANIRNSVSRERGGHNVIVSFGRVYRVFNRGCYYVYANDLQEVGSMVEYSTLAMVSFTVGFICLMCGILIGILAGGRS
jgi:hypothetical protein